MSNPRKEIHDHIWNVLEKNQKKEGNGDAPKPTSSLRQHLWNLLEYDQGKLGRCINWVLLSLLLLSVILLPIEFVDTLAPYRSFSMGVEIFTTLIFTTEYFLRMYAAPERLRYILSWQGIFDLLAAVPYYFTFLPFSAGIRQFFPAVRLLRLLKIIHIKSLEETDQEIKEKSLSRFVDLMEGEVIEKIALKHPLFFLLNLILPIFLGSAGVFVLLFWNFQVYALMVSVILFFFMLVFFYNAWLDYYHDVIYITNYRLIFQDQHLFGHASNQVEYRSITNIRPRDTGILSALLKYGTILIETSADQGFIEDANIRDHEKIANFIQQKCRNYTTEQHSAIFSGSKNGQN